MNFRDPSVARVYRPAAGRDAQELSDKRALEGKETQGWQATG